MIKRLPLILLTTLLILSMPLVYAAPVYHGYFKMVVHVGKRHSKYFEYTAFTISIDGKTLVIQGDSGHGEFKIIKVYRLRGYKIYYIQGSGIFKGYQGVFKGFVKIGHGKMWFSLHQCGKRVKVTMWFRGHV